MGSCKHHGSPGGGEGREPPGTVSRAWRWPGVTPGVGTHPTETATGPGSTLTARGGADSLWLQRFAFLKLQPLDTVELYDMALCSVIFLYSSQYMREGTIVTRERQKKG